MDKEENENIQINPTIGIKSCDVTEGDFNLSDLSSNSHENKNEELLNESIESFNGIKFKIIGEIDLITKNLKTKTNKLTKAEKMIVKQDKKEDVEFIQSFDYLQNRISDNSNLSSKESETTLFNTKNNKEFLLVSDYNFFSEDNNFDFYEISDKYEINKIADRIYTNYCSSKLVFNIESKYRDFEILEHFAIDLIILLRCKYNYMKPILCLGFEPIESILSRRPQDVVLCSPGMKYQQLPCKEVDFNNIPTLINQNYFKQYLIHKVENILISTRHKNANYAGMSLMMYVIKQIWAEIHKDEQVLGGGNNNYPDYYKFKLSFDYFILKYFFNLTSINIPNEHIEAYKINLGNKKILLIDDFAEKGWLQILSQMISGNSNSKNIRSLPIDSFSEELISKEIKEFKPHLILLDLRLYDESGKAKLVDLKGYQFLKFIKKDFLLKGLPVIMFTATTNAENVKDLISMGAEAVWTKPGFDERLLNTDVSRRYKSLLYLIKNTLGKYSDEKFVNLNKLNTYDIKTEKREFESIRIALLKRNQYLKYRIELNKPDVLNNYFEKFSEIFIDTNILISGEIHDDNTEKDFAKTLRNIYTLALISTDSEYDIEIDDIQIVIKLPKMVIVNSVLDEMIKFSKLNNPTETKLWRRALLAYDIIRGMFEKNLLRTEINSYNDKNTPLCVLKRPEQIYADNDIIKNIKLIHEKTSFKIGKYEKIKNQFSGKFNWEINLERSKQIKILNNKDKPTLLITDDAGLRQLSRKLISHEHLEILSISKFNRIIEEISL